MKKKIDNLDFKSRGKLGLLGGFLIHIVLGSTYIWANLCEYITAYFVQQKGQYITTKDVNIVFPIILLSFPIGISQGANLANKFGPQRVSFVCSIGICLSIMLSSVATKFWMFAFFYGFTAGIFMGFIYMIPLDNASKFFPNRKGTAYGTIICGYGIGSLVFNWILYYLINPQNLKAQWNEEQQEYLYPPEVSSNLPSTLVSLAIMYLVISLIGSYFIIKPSQRDLLEVQASLISLQSLQQLGVQSKEVIIQKEGSDNISEEDKDNQQIRDKKSESQEQIQKETTEITWNEAPLSAKEEYKLEKKREKEMMNISEEECRSVSVALRQKELYVSLTLACIGVCYGLVISSNYKSYGLSFHNNDQYYYIISTASSISNGFSRIFWGYLMDKMKLKKLIQLNLLFQITLNISMPFIAQNSFLYCTYIVLTFLCYGGWYVIMPAHCYKLFGSIIAPKIYFILALGFPLSGVIQQIIVKNFSWNNVFLILFAIQALGIFIVNIFPITINWREKQFLENLQTKFQYPKQSTQTQESKSSSLSSNQQNESPSKNQQPIIIQKNNYYMMNYEI